MKLVVQNLIMGEPMNKISTVTLNNITRKTVKELGDEYLKFMKYNIDDGVSTASSAFITRVFKNSSLNRSDYSHDVYIIIGRTVVNVFLNKLGYMQHKFSPRLNSLIIESKPKYDNGKLDDLFDKPVVNTKTTKHMLAQINTNPCNEVLMNITSKNCKLLGEKPMKQSLIINRPVLIGTTDILTAQTFELDAIIREAQSQIDNNADLCAVSQYHRQEKLKLEEVINLCVAQLDKGLKTKETLVS